MKHTASKMAGAFSLVELLVAIFILLTLSALLFSVTPRVVEKSRATACVQKLRNNGVLIRAIIADNKGVLPWYDKSKPGFTGLWWHQVYRASGLTAENFSKSFTCPSDRTPWAIRVTSTETVAFTYRYNRRAGYHSGTAWVYPKKNLALLPNPSRVPILADSAVQPTDNSFLFDEWNMVYTAHGGKAYREGNYGNALFLDGHVEKIEKPANGSTVQGDYDLKMTAVN